MCSVKNEHANTNCYDPSRKSVMREYQISIVKMYETVFALEKGTLLGEYSLVACAKKTELPPSVLPKSRNPLKQFTPVPTSIVQVEQHPIETSTPNDKYNGLLKNCARTKPPGKFLCIVVVYLQLADQP
jgi:hypothetical protein